MVIVAIAQNSRTVRVHYIVWQSNVSLIVVVLTTALAAILLDQAGGLIWRRRRRARLSRPERARRSSGARSTLPEDRTADASPAPAADSIVLRALSGSRVKPPNVFLEAQYRVAEACNCNEPFQQFHIEGIR